MRVDTHVHIFQTLKFFPKAWTDAYFRQWEEIYGKEVMERRRAALDGSVEALIRDMDEAGVDKAVISAQDFASMCGQEPEISVWRYNEYLAEAQEKYPTRIIGFVCVDPLRKDSVDLLEKGIRVWGLKGVKIFPTTFKVTDESVQPFMAKINELELTVLVHQGSDPLPYTIDHGNPADLDILTLRYPNIKIIAAHLGRGYEDCLAALLYYRKGIMYTDITGFQRDYQQSRWHFIMQLRYLMDRVPGAVLMGSDWPFLTIPPDLTYREWFDAIRNLKIPEQALALGMRDFSQQEKDMILGGNAERLLQLG